MKLTALTCMLILSACATPSLKEWSGDKITLCCRSSACSDESWRERIAKMCQGRVTPVSAKREEKVRGYVHRKEKEKEEDGKKTETKRFEVERYVEECRTYRCEGEVVL